MVDEYQPSISPDGSKLCYTRQSTLSNTGTADIYVADLPGLTNQRDISDTTGIGDINCTWSPDGGKVAFSNGSFSAARLMVENANDADDTPALNELTNDTGATTSTATRTGRPTARRTAPTSRPPPSRTRR